jgi:hypothetical protein
MLKKEVKFEVFVKMMSVQTLLYVRKTKYLEWVVW